MTDAAILRAAYADFRLVKTRRCIQLVFECPIEDADNALRAVGGMPDAGAERWFAIARLTNETKKPTETKSVNRLVQRAGILCGDEQFQTFLRTEYPDEWNPHTALEHDDDQAVFVLRSLCRIESRKELATNEPAAAIFNAIDAQYESWRRAL